MLTEVEVKGARAKERAYKMGDKEGLYLFVAPSGAKTWRYDYRFEGKRQTLVIGRYPEVSLKAARGRHFEARQLLERDKNPTRVKQERKKKAVQAAENTLKAQGQQWFEETAPHRSQAWQKAMRGLLENHIYPPLGSRPMDGIEPAEVLTVVRGIADGGHARTAETARWIISRIFRYAIRNLRATSNPASEVRGALQLPPTKHHAPIPAKELPEFLKRVEKYQGRAETRLALKLLLLTFVRKSEVAGARWEEFDLKAAEWRIPAERMKMRTPHFVPLSRQAVEVLKELRKLTGRREYCFPHLGDPRAHMSTETFNQAFRTMGYGGRFSPHGLRATASTILNERGYSADWIERQLAHQQRNKVRAAYNQAQYIPERKKMMQAWADYLGRLVKECKADRSGQGAE